MLHEAAWTVEQRLFAFFFDSYHRDSDMVKDSCDRDRDRDRNCDRDCDRKLFA